MTPDLAALIREQRGDLDALEAEATDGPAAIRHRRRVLCEALTPVPAFRGRRQRRRPVVGRYFRLQPASMFVPWDGPDTSLRPWESRAGYVAEMFDGWAE